MMIQVRDATDRPIGEFQFQAAIASFTFITSGYNFVNCDGVGDTLGKYTYKYHLITRCTCCQKYLTLITQNTLKQRFSNSTFCWI